MSTARRTWRVIGVVSLLAVSTALLLPTFTGRPVVSYASSGSMEPTIGAFDIFFVNPLPGELAIGDVVVYDSITRGGPAVHRIVGGDAESGWTTQGDANPTVDQTSGEPPVTRDRVLGEVVTRADGRPILIPDVGLTFVEARADLVRAQNAVGGPRAFAAVAFLLIAIVLGTASVSSHAKREVKAPMSRRKRALLRRLLPRGLLGKHVGLGLLLVLVGCTAWGASHAAAEVDVAMVVVEDPTAADGLRAEAPGGTIPRELEVRGFRLLPTLVVLEPEGERLAPQEGSTWLPPGGTWTARIEQTAGSETGLQHDVVRAWRYPALLPRPILEALHEVAPGGPWYLAGAFVALGGAAWFAMLRVAELPVGRMLGVREEWL